MGKTCVVCVTDENYFQYFKPLFASIKKFNKHMDVHCHCINFVTPELYALRDQGELSFSSEYVSKKKVNSTNKENAHEKDGFPAYCANKRVLVLNDLKDKYECLIYMDVDSIVRASLNDLIEEVRRSPGILIHKRLDSDTDVSKVAAGVIAIYKNENSYKFLDKWNKEVKPIINNWFGDQKSFFKVFSIPSYQETVEHLDSKYIDWMFQNESVIWSGKGNRKYSKQKYQELQDSFLGLFEKRYLEVSNEAIKKSQRRNLYFSLREKLPF